MRLFLVRRYQFAKMLSSSQSAMTTSRFLRLMALALATIAFAFPISLLLLVQAIQNPQQATNWAYVHTDFGDSNIFTNQSIADNAAYYPQIYTTFLLAAWCFPVACTIFFLIFGLGDDAVGMYRSWGRVVWRLVSFTRSSSKSRYVVLQNPPGLLAYLFSKLQVSASTNRGEEWRTGSWIPSESFGLLGGS